MIPVYVIGIDPGLGGAVVVLEATTARIMASTRMPALQRSQKARAVNGAALASFLVPYKRYLSHVIIEEVASRPEQGVASMFAFGKACGVVEGVVAGCELPMEFVTPTTWKSTFRLNGKPKDAARAAAIRLWPEWRVLDKVGEGQAHADAALIARHYIISNGIPYETPRLADKRPASRRERLD